MLQHPVASHAVEEATERAACGVILPRISHQHHKDILDNLLGRPRASGHAQGKAVERRLMAPIKERKGLLVALCSPPEQHVVSFLDRKSTRLNSSHDQISYAVFCLKKKKKNKF